LSLLLLSPLGDNCTFKLAANSMVLLVGMVVVVTDDVDEAVLEVVLRKNSTSSTNGRFRRTVTR
jgi:hypothetical protein